MMRPARAEAARLSEAMQDTRPNCEGWADIFTSDQPADVETLTFAAELCRTCPLLIECGAYARAARPGVGIWAGIEHTKTAPRRPRNTKKEN
jgi:hypothetical protein